MGRFFGNRKGVTFIEILVALGVFGLLGTVFATSFVEVFKAQKLVETKDRANDFSSSLSRYLYKDSSCASSLMNQKIPDVGNEEEFKLKQFVGYGSGSTPTDLEQDLVIDDSLKIKSLTIADAGIPPEDITSGGNILRRLNAKIKLNLEVRNKDNWIAVAPRYFEIPVFTDPTSREIRGCSLEMQATDACTLLGSTLDPRTGLCQQATQCLLKGHYIDNTCSPSTGSCPADEVNEFTRRTSCPSGATAYETGKFAWSYEESCGKKCSRTITVNQEFFICQVCN